jgi:hypothetical protein
MIPPNDCRTIQRLHKPLRQKIKDSRAAESGAVVTAVYQFVDETYISTILKH